MPPTLSYCVVNTNGREDLLACLDAIEATHPAGVEAEVLVLDNASTDGSVEAVGAWDRERGGRRAVEGPTAETPAPGAGGERTGDDDRATNAGARAGPLRLIAQEQRTGKAENDSTLLREARGDFCLLLNEDSELRAGAAATLLAALEAEPRGAAAGAQLLDSGGDPVPCAWRFPGVGAALAGALFLHRWLTVQSGGGGAGRGGYDEGRAGEPRPVEWAQSSALMVRREAAAEVGYLDPAFFVYYDECDFCKRLAVAGWRTLFVPAAEAVHHDQLSTDLAAGLPRIVEFHRNRDLYMRKHHGRAAALAVRLLTAWSYAVRTLVALVAPSRSARIMSAHARQALSPHRGESIRDRAGRVESPSR
ncbi:MAG: glycosyltransferase family 2 protein [Solirubrobacterales bacterium]